MWFASIPRGLVAEDGSGRSPLEVYSLYICSSKDMWPYSTRIQIIKHQMMMMGGIYRLHPVWAGIFPQPLHRFLGPRDIFLLITRNFQSPSWDKINKWYLHSVNSSIFYWLLKGLKFKGTTVYLYIRNLAISKRK